MASMILCYVNSNYLSKRANAVDRGRLKVKQQYYMITAYRIKFFQSHFHGICMSEAREKYYCRL